MKAKYVKYPNLHYCGQVLLHLKTLRLDRSRKRRDGRNRLALMAEVRRDPEALACYRVPAPGHCNCTKNTTK